MRRAAYDRATSRAKEELLAGGDPGWFDKVTLVDSWRRSISALGDPGALRELPQVPEFWLDDEPLALLREPLQSMAESLHGNQTAMMLADRRGIVLERWFVDRSAGRHLDATGCLHRRTDSGSADWPHAGHSHSHLSDHRTA